MSDRPASWRFPAMKQIEKFASRAKASAESPPAPPVGPADDLPDRYWEALLEEAQSGDHAVGKFQARRLFEVSRHLLRVSCSRCGRTVEIQKADAVRLYGLQAFWKDVGQKLLDNTCAQRTGRHEEDGCWPSYDVP